MAQGFLRKYYFLREFRKMRILKLDHCHKVMTYYLKFGKITQIVLKKSINPQLTI